MTRSVYLAGPITGLTYAEAQDGWRAVAEEWGGLHGVRMLSPLRGKEYLRDVGRLEKQYLHLSPLSSPHGIVHRDFNDVRNADCILANFLDATGASIGTAFEFGAAFALRTPIITVREKGSVHDHPFITIPSTYVFDNMDEALDALAFLLAVGVGR